MNDQTGIIADILSLRAEIAEIVYMEDIDAARSLQALYDNDEMYDNYNHYEIKWLEQELEPLYRFIKSY